MHSDQPAAASPAEIGQLQSPSAKSNLSAIPATQKSWRVVAKGVPAKALSLAEMPVPKLNKGDILVKVQAVSLNPVGNKLLDLLPAWALRRIKAHEFDLAGVVVDANGTDFKTGDEVIGIIPVPQLVLSGQGALAQYARVAASNAVPRPTTVTPTQAAGFPTTALTAYQALVKLAKLKAGQSVFINGGSTAVGSFAIQIAKALGAHVAVSASAKNEQYVRALGADEFFDYTKAPLHEQLIAANPSPKYHVLLETVGFLDPTLFVESPAYLAPQGIFITVGPQGSGIANWSRCIWKVMLQPSWLGGTKRKWQLISVKPNKEEFEALAQFIEEGKVKPLVDSVFSFEDALKAYDRIMTNRATGKVIIKVDPSVE